MKTHDQFAEDLALYALNELADSEQQEMEGHLQTCSACRRELHAMRADLALLGLSLSGPQPPARSKERLMRAVAAEPRGVSAPDPAPASQRRLWAILIPSLAALGLFLVALVLIRHNINLKDEVAELGNRNQDQIALLDRMSQELELLTSPDAVHVSLHPQKMPRQPSGTAIYSPSNQRMMFMASNLAPVPEGKAYELWIIPMHGAPASSSLTIAATPS